MNQEMGTWEILFLLLSEGNNWNYSSEARVGHYPTF